MELEYKFNCEDLEAVKEKAKSLGFSFSKKKHQIDTYFIVCEKKEDSGDYLRIREEEGRVRLDYHRALSLLATEEYEVGFENKEIMVEILKLLGYDVVCIVDKEREEYVKDHVTITSDMIKELGSFVELEVEGEESKEVGEELKSISKRI
tara:strand:+ start:1135 stop:1584 length:450 start_codon:yes stop_codon:yes gene_type:complete